MWFKGDSGIARQHTIKNTPVQYHNNDRDEYRKEVSSKESKKHEEEGKGIHYPTGPNMNGRTSKNPNQNVGPEVGADEYLSSDLWINEEEYRAQKKHWDGIRYEVQYIAMN